MVKTEKLLEWIALNKTLKHRGKSVFCEACEHVISADQRGYVKQVNIN